MSSSIQRSAVSGQRAASTARPACARRAGFTLMEIMIVVAIIAILVVIVAWAGSRLLNDAKVKQTHSVMNALKSAMREYRDATQNDLVSPPGYFVNVPPGYGDGRLLPPTEGGVRTDYYRQEQNGKWTPLTAPTADRKISGTDKPINDIWAVPDGTIQPVFPDDYHSNTRRVYGIQALYHCLMQEPRSRQVLEKLGSSSSSRGTTLGEYFTTQTGTVQVSDFLIGDGAGTQRPRETQAILDGWGRPLYYARRHDINNDQPYVQSAGPDGQFGNDDDIFSFKE
jgi:prepilin-type N-terminal cleavage/methylation domain-containing protein